MTGRWLSLLLGIVLLQGTLSFSPIDETSEEWIEYLNLMRDARYRLPTTTSPINYNVHLTPHLAEGENQFKFDGQVIIRMRPNIVTREITLHCNDLTIQSVFVASATVPATNLIATGQTFACGEFDFLTILTNADLVMTQDYLITINFNGNLQTNMRGFYRSWYIDGNGNRRWMATTQFQPGHARQAFPCYDEPGFKATFDISITRDTEGFSQTLSNMPLINTVLSANQLQTREYFATTPITSTYLLAFIVSDYSRIESNNNAARPFHIYARGNAGSTGEWSLRIGVPLLEVMERYTAISYYGMATTGMEMKQAAIPDFSAGAMENWGLLTYREALILFDPENSNNFYKQRVANIISHEIAHMWFGNLVTCAWWDNLWLNEGFARFYQYYLTDAVAPELGFDTRFITEQVQVSLLSDSSTNAHPLTDTSVTDPSSVSAHFSQITYGKGAAVLRMTQHLLSNDTYVKGLRSYLSNNQFSTAQPSDLFTALQSAATADGALAAYSGINVETYLRSWTERAGHPLVTVTVNHATGDITITQTRFYQTTEWPTNTDVWYIPITWTRAGNPDFIDLKPSRIFNQNEVTFNRGSVGNEWVIFNKQQSGFYRVNYDSTTWALITRALRGAERTTIHEYNRAQIVDDVFLLARANKLTYTQAFNILSFLKFEDQYAPWLAAITGFNFALRRLAHGSLASNRLRSEILDLSEAVVNRLGFTEPATGSTFMDELQRMHVMTFLCNVGHQGCINAARTSFLAWRNGANIAPNLRPWVYCNGLRFGSSQDYDFFWEKYLDTELASEQVVMLTAAGCTRDQPSLNRFLFNILGEGTGTNFVIRAQDYSTAISSAITSNEENTLRVFQWLQNNLARVVAATGIIRPMLSSISSRLLTEANIAAVEAWVDSNVATIGTLAVADARAGFTTSRANIQFYNARLEEFNAYFDVGYVDELDPNPTTTLAPTTEAPTTEAITTLEPTQSTTEATTTLAPTTAEPTTTESTTAETTTTPPVETSTPEPDSANIASLSIVTLIVTLVINMV